MPYIPCARNVADFWSFSQAGRGLAELHIIYESAAPSTVNFASGDESFMDKFEDQDYRVENMKFGKKGRDINKSL